MSRGEIHIGTSGWHYRHWVGPFYPEHTPSRDYLRYYARHFRTTEINNTFYNLPAAGTLAEWRDQTPEGFCFACKASRYITHMKKLKDPQQSTQRFFDAIDTLGERLGPVLFQLPPNWRVDPGRLAAFLEALPTGPRYTFEFRDHSWHCGEIFTILERHRAALCIYDLAGYRSPVITTAGFTYVRLHGPGNAYQGRYDGRTLAGWARRITGWREAGLDVYCYFDNDEAGYAPHDALRLNDMAD